MRSRIALLATAGLIALVTVFAGCVDAFRTYKVEVAGPPTWNGGPGKTSIKDLIASPGAHCLNCHQGNGIGVQATGYKVDTYLNATAPYTTPQGDTHDAVLNGDPDASILIWRLEGKTNTGGILAPMPFDGWVGDSDRSPMAPTAFVTTFRTWITNGAPEN